MHTPSHWWMPPKRRCRPGPSVLFFVSSTLSASSRSCASDFSGRAYLCARTSRRGRLGPLRRLAASDPRKVKEGAGDARRDDRLLHDLTRHTDNDARPVRLLGAGPYLNLAHRRRRDDVARRVGGVGVPPGSGLPALLYSGKRVRRPPGGRGGAGEGYVGRSGSLGSSMGSIWATAWPRTWPFGGVHVQSGVRKGPPTSDLCSTD